MFDFNKDKFRVEGLIAGLLIGAVVAAVTSLLFAPKSGKELRTDIGKGTSKALDQADDYLETARKKGGDMVDDVSDAASSYFNVATDKVDDSVNKTKGFFNRKSKEVENKVEEVADEIDKM